MRQMMITSKLMLANLLLVVSLGGAALMTERVFAHEDAAQQTAAKSASDVAAGEVIARIDVGNEAAFTDSEGRAWSPDVKLFSPARAFAESRGKPEIVGATDPTIYRTYRGNVGGSTPQTERILTFQIPVRHHRLVDLRLHFAELYWGAPGGGPAGPGKRIFDVEAGGRTVLADFDITRQAGGALTAVIMPIRAVKIENNLLTITLKAKKDFAAISAIEVLAHQ